MAPARILSEIASRQLSRQERGVSWLRFGSFQSSGNLATLSVGANAKLIPNKVEVGAIYTTSIAAQRDFSFNGFLVRMAFRY